jgi:hypothetical protein
VGASTGGSTSGTTTGSSCQPPNPDAGTAVDISNKSNINYDSRWVTGIYQLGGHGGFPNGSTPGPLTIDDSNACAPVLYALDVAGNQVLRYDIASDAFDVLYTFGGPGFMGQPLQDILFVADFAGAGPTLLISLSGNNQESIVSLPVMTGASTANFSGGSPSNFTPTGLAHCPAGGRDAILSIDNQNSGNDPPNTGNGLFWSAPNRSLVSAPLLGTTGQPIPTGAPNGEFKGVTGTGLEGICDSSASPVIFAATQYNTGGIWWLKLDGTDGVEVVSGAPNCVMYGSTSAAHACVHNPFGVRYSSGGHLVWANSLPANAAVGYMSVGASTGTAADAPAFLVEGNQCTAGPGQQCTGPNLTVPTGLAFDSNGNLYIGDEGGNVFRVTLTDGF